MSMLSLPARPESHLRQDRAELVEELEALEKKVRGRAMTKSEKMDWDKVQDKIDDMTGEIERQVRMKERMARKPDGFGAQQQTATSGLVAAARALHGGKTTTVNEKNIEEFFSPQHRALNSTSAANALQNPFLSPAAGVIFDPIFNSVITSLGFDVFDLEANYYKYPKVAAYPVMSAYSEAQDIPTGDPVVDAVQFTAKNYGLLVKVHNNVLRDAGPVTDAIIEGVFQRAIEQMFLTSAFYGAAGSGQFVGLDNAADVQTISAGDAVLSNYDLILQAGEQVMSVNGDPSKLSAIMHPKVWRQLQTAKDTTGQQLMKPNGLDNWSMLNSTAIKTNYGAGTDQTRLYVGDFSTVKLGIEGRYEMRLDQTFAASDMTAFAVVVRADMQLFHPEQIVRIQDVDIA